ncbi:MAG: hypothetical protein L0Y72_15400 [Gemmataceae bacterium]|nr:hypothetical protein [Gemmataceae bacterium]MCI0740431.1 hypothetical protein [Gemmataceae bacterium]
MMNPHEFARKQMELTAEFARYVVEHPEVDELLPEQSYIYFEVSGEVEFNRFSRELAEKQLRAEGVPIVCVRTKGLSPPQGSRLIDPQISPTVVPA